ncbi:MAG: right-handed parallel beta-helix repeat-containing protein, partial [Thermoplasmata archaeon]|nr:right-handed parallel beta-helix repeat-containing protein [Thermoplasmata archaeon]
MTGGLKMGNNKERVIIYSLSIMMLMAGFSGLFILDDNVLGSDVKDQPTPPSQGIVDNLDTGETFSKIQDAINDVDTLNGHTLYVYAETYKENVNVNKQVIINGEDSSTTIVDGDFSVSVNNVVISNFTTTGSPGISLSSVQNCKVADNIVTGSASSGQGISLSSADFNFIERNDVSVSPVAQPWRYGISMEYSDNNYLDGNIGANNWATMRMDYCTGNTFRNNVMTNDGIAILGYIYSYYDHDVDTSNTMNGNPIYYWKNVVGGTVPEGAGQVYLVNCQDVIVENQNIEMSATGIDLVLSTGCTVRDCTVRNSYFGIDLLLSDGCYVTNND